MIMKNNNNKEIPNKIEIPNYKLFTKNIVNIKNKKSSKNIEEKLINYKNIDLLKTFITEEKGKILPARSSGISAKNQRKISKAIKQARQMLLLP